MMKAPDFIYRRPDSIAAAIALLGEGDDPMLLAGGQSLMPMMNLRMARPDVVIDLNRIEGLSYVREEDQIAIEVRELLIDLDVSRELFQLALQEADLSGEMREAEVRRFESGASDFFVVNVREQTEANALIRLVSASLAIREARANLDAATVATARLGIDPDALPSR